MTPEENETCDERNWIGLLSTHCEIVYKTRRAASHIFQKSSHTGVLQKIWGYCSVQFRNRLKNWPSPIWNSARVQRRNHFRSLMTLLSGVEFNSPHDVLTAREHSDPLWETRMLRKMAGDFATTRTWERRRLGRWRFQRLSCAGTGDSCSGIGPRPSLFDTSNGWAIGERSGENRHTSCHVRPENWCHSAVLQPRGLRLPPRIWHIVLRQWRVSPHPVPRAPPALPSECCRVASIS